MSIDMKAASPVLMCCSGSLKGISVGETCQCLVCGSRWTLDGVSSVWGDDQSASQHDLCRCSVGTRDTTCLHHQRDAHQAREPLRWLGTAQFSEGMEYEAKPASGYLLTAWDYGKATFLGLYDTHDEAKAAAKADHRGEPPPAHQGQTPDQRGLHRARELLSEWLETPNEGDAMVDCLLGVIREAHAALGGEA